MRDWKDRLGILSSAVCAIHCAATPILLATLPTLKLTEWMADPRFHQTFAVVCSLLVAVAIMPMAWRFRDLHLLSLASTGLGLILTAAFLMPESCCSTAHSSGHSEWHAEHDHGHAHDSQTPTLLNAGMGIAQPWMTPIGGLLLIFAHGLNMKRRWRSSCHGTRRCHGLHENDDVIPLAHRDVGEGTTLARAS